MSAIWLSCRGSFLLCHRRIADTAACIYLLSFFSSPSLLCFCMPAPPWPLLARCWLDSPRSCRCRDLKAHKPLVERAFCAKPSMQAHKSLVEPAAPRELQGVRLLLPYLSTQGHETLSERRLSQRSVLVPAGIMIYKHLFDSNDSKQKIF